MEELQLEQSEAAAQGGGGGDAAQQQQQQELLARALSKGGSSREVGLGKDIFFVGLTDEGDVVPQMTSVMSTFTPKYRLIHPPVWRERNLTGVLLNDDLQGVLGGILVTGKGELVALHSQFSYQNDASRGREVRILCGVSFAACFGISELPGSVYEQSNEVVENYIGPWEKTRFFNRDAQCIRTAGRRVID